MVGEKIEGIKCPFTLYYIVPLPLPPPPPLSLPPPPLLLLLLLLPFFFFFHFMFKFANLSEVLNNKELKHFGCIMMTSLYNWPTGNRNWHHALRLHVTNASFKQWVGILLKPNIDRCHLTSEIWEETHLKELFYGTLIFQQNSMICIDLYLYDYILAFQHGGRNNVHAQMCCKLYHLTFWTFPWSLSAKFVFRKR